MIEFKTVIKSISYETLQEIKYNSVNNKYIYDLCNNELHNRILKVLLLNLHNNHKTRTVNFINNFLKDAHLKIYHFDIKDQDLKLLHKKLKKLLLKNKARK